MNKRFEEEEGEEGEHARRRIERRAMASLTLWSDWANKSRTWTILALALSARSSGSPHTARSAFEIGSRRPSCVRMRQKSLRGVGPCERGTESAPVRTSIVERRDETHVHLEDPADAVDGHPDEVLALLVCSVESISTCVDEKRGRERDAQSSSSISTSVRRPWHETNICSCGRVGERGSASCCSLLTMSESEKS